jgi:gas vesicle protein
VPHEKIVQAWRTTEFPPDAPDSMLTITFTAAEGGATRIGLLQETIPEGQAAAYKKGWDEHYFGPMKSWFARTSTLGKAKEAFEEVLEDAKEAAEQTVKEVKKAQKKAAATIKKVSAQVSKKVQSLLKKKKPAKKKVVKTVKKRAAPAKKKKKSLPKKKKK